MSSNQNDPIAVATPINSLQSWRFTGQVAIMFVFKVVPLF